MSTTTLRPSAVRGSTVIVEGRLDYHELFLNGLIPSGVAFQIAIADRIIVENTDLYSADRIHTRLIAVRPSPPHEARNRLSIRCSFADELSVVEQLVAWVRD